MVIEAALRDAAARLAETSDTPRLDAEMLMAHAIGTTREALLLGRRDAPAPEDFAALVERRSAHEPVAYITGRRAFWSIELDVTSAVLIPRPDSETLIEAAIDHFGTAAPARILDLGTGSGALLLAALAHWPAATGVGIDASEGAIAVARANAARITPGRAEMRIGGWEEGADGSYDLVLCNPPYIATGTVLPPQVADYEPASALFAGDDGLDDYRRIARALRLPAGGVACIEIGADQGDVASALFAVQGFAVRVARDLAGRDRCLVITPQT